MVQPIPGLRAFIDLAGRRIGTLRVLEYVGDGAWLVVCDCGKTKNMQGSRLRGSAKVAPVRSCGCGYVLKYPRPKFYKATSTEVS